MKIWMYWLVVWHYIVPVVKAVVAYVKEKAKRHG